MKAKLRKVYWFAHASTEGASVRYRGFYPIELLKNENGINCKFVFPSRNYVYILNFTKAYLSALLNRNNDFVVVIQKVCSNRIYANMLKFLVSVKPAICIYDLDDAEYFRQDSKTLHFFLRKCGTISVGSAALKEYCKDFNNNVVVLTSPVMDHNHHKGVRNKTTNVGWVGDLGNGNKISRDFSHKTSMFNILFPQIKLIEKPITLTIIGVKNKSDIPEIHNYFKNNSNIKVIIPVDLEWEHDKWVYSEIKKFDIGVSPLTNHMFNVSKSAFKAKQYLSAGIPTIASDIGENNKFVKHNWNGFLCQNNNGFKTAIETIIDMSSEEYLRLSVNARNSQKEFSMRKYCDSLLKTYNIAIQQDGKMH